MPDITSANAVFALSVPLLFPIPFQLQGFSADDIFSTEPVKIARTVIGVDGIMSGGFTPFIVPQNIFLQADSQSNLSFETWAQTMKTTRSLLAGNAIITLPSIRRKYTCTFGILETYPPIADAKQTLQPRRYTIHWQDVSPASF